MSQTVSYYLSETGAIVSLAFEGQAFNSGRTWDVTVPRSLRLHVRTLRLERVSGSFVGAGLRGRVTL